jgi:hypothetical protein
MEGEEGTTAVLLLQELTEVRKGGITEQHEATDKLI